MDDRSRSPFRFDRFTLDPARGCLRDGAGEIPLRPKAYDVLRHLAARADHLVSKDEIMAAVWPGVFVTDDSLVHAVAELRKALGDRDQRIIRTVPRRGYRFMAPVSVAPEGPERARDVPSAPPARPVRPRLPLRRLLPMAASLAGLLAAAGAWQLWPGAAAPARGTVGEGMLADEVAEAVAAELERLDGPETTAPAPSPAAGYVLEGTIQRLGDRVRVAVRLTESRPDPRPGDDGPARPPAAEVRPVGGEMADGHDPEWHAQLGDALGAMGELARAEAEFGKALALGPDSPGVLARYAGWASTFGRPEEGLAAAVRAIRLSPDMPDWALGHYRHAHFMAGLHEDSLRFSERKSRETWGPCDFVMHAAILAALGRTREARAAAADALTRYPTLTIEGYTMIDNVWSEAERAMLVPAMRGAGFPACAEPEEVAKAPLPRRLPGCGTA